MLRDRPLLFGSLIVLLGASMFAMLGPLSRFAYERGMEPLPFVAWRAGIASIFLAALVGLGVGRGRPIVRRRSLDRRGAASLGVAALMAFLLNLSMFEAFDRVSVALALLGFYTYPAMIVAVAVATGREPVNRAKLVALAGATIGMVLVVGGAIGAEPEMRGDPLGILLALGAAASQTIFVTVSRSGYRAVPADQAMTIIIGGTLVGCLAVTLVAGLAEPMMHPLRDPGVIPIILVAGSAGAAIPSLLFLVGIRRIGGTRAGILMLFEPVVGVMLAALLLDEAITLVQALGGAAILAAAALLQRAGDATVSGHGLAAAEAQDEEVVARHVPGGP